MKGKYFKSIVVIVLLTVLTLTLICFCACDRNAVPKYQSLPGQVGKTYDGLNRVLPPPDIEILASVEELRNCYYLDLAPDEELDEDIDIENIESYLTKYYYTDLEYSEEFFRANVIMMVLFTFASSDKDIEFKDIAIKGGKFYPIFETSSPKRGGYQTCDTMKELYVIECSRDVLNYEFGQTLALNRNDVNNGSAYHDGIRTVFK